MRGMIAPRVADAIANTADWIATSTRISPTLRTLRMVWASRASVTSHVPTEDRKYSSRRSMASAIAPPYRPNTTIGSSPTSPTSPTVSEEWERS